MLTSRVLGDIQGAGARILSLQEQLVTGKRINRPSDDPTATALVMGYAGRQAGIEQFMRNADAALDRLSVTENALTGTQDLLSRAHVLAEKGASDTASPEVRAGLATEVNQLLEELLSRGNTLTEGHYIFGGRADSTAAFTATRNANGEITAVAASANADDVLTRQVDDGDTITLNVKAGDVFGTSGGPALNIYQQLIDLRDRLRANDGDGVRALVTPISDGAGQVGQELAVVGARQNRLTDLKNRFRLDETMTTAARSRLEDVSATEALVKLQTEQNTLQAALSTGAKILKMSLMDYLS
jgi:flagellar hook-associated protein 3 FlgL